MSEAEAKKNYLTRSGYEKIVNELNNLKEVRRNEIAQEIKEARGQGDLSENAEYDAARDEQGKIEARIVEIERILKNVEVVEDSDINIDEVNVGCTVKVYDVEFEEEIEYQLVGSSEANSLQNKISNESPVGRALIGHKVSDMVTVETQNGELQFEIMSIARTEE